MLGTNRHAARGRRAAHPFATLIDLLVDASADYLIGQFEAGVDAAQIFNTWAGVLPAGEFRKWCAPPPQIFQPRPPGIIQSTDCPWSADGQSIGTIFHHLESAQFSAKIARLCPDAGHRLRRRHRQRRREGLCCFSIEMSKADIDDAIARGILKADYDAWDVLDSWYADHLSDAALE